ncbi:MAG: sigma-54-dependent Fis family transcriptional regulator [Gemmatimonadetes bacterium]|nr:MAG: sigma-54-dependent Fis family transcriptional regulator [Gemmatimonadota bacterium]
MTDYSGSKILIVDDEQSICEFMSIMLRKEGYEVVDTTSSVKAIDLIESEPFDVVITDIKMPEKSGIEVLRVAKQVNPQMPVIIMTAYATLDTAIEAVNQGAFYYLIKKARNEEIKQIVRNALEVNRLRAENRRLKRELKSRSEWSGIIGDSPAIQDVLELVRKVAASESTVLIRGESGTGKELIAQAIHYNSARADGPFVTINCAALPETLLESELFGHVKGSFTGAIRDKEGLFSVARNGTFFLDEIGDTPPSIQVKLLRVLQEREIVPVGGTKPLKVDVRVIAATNVDLEEEVRRGSFRADLFYRLNVIPIHIPPLRHRRGDIRALAEYFLRKYCNDNQLEPKKIAKDAMTALENYRWPGNVRELQNIIERAVILQKGSVIQKSDLPPQIRGDLTEDEETMLTIDERPTLEDLEREYILRVLTETDWKLKDTAEILKIDPSTLHRKIKKYDLKKQSSLIDLLSSRIKRQKGK